MEYGLLGVKLSHSYSKEIHNLLGDYQYELIEIQEKDLKTFIKNKDFKAINVTMPFKEKVIPYLDYLDKSASACKSVNLIFKKNGVLYGYNTDYYGLKDLIEYSDIEIKDKKILILGTGGTSKTAYLLVNDLGAKEVTFVSSSNKINSISYEEAILRKDIEVIINATPVGMYPNINKKIIDINHFPKLESVIDVIYNPLKTTLVKNALKKGLKVASGLYMLVSQANYASSIFLDKEIDKNKTEEIYKQILKSKQNIVLIGMPSSGKSTIGKVLEEKLNKKLVDIDEKIEKRISKSIKNYILENGEEKFRKIEKELVEYYSKQNNLIISTGGGVIKEDVNISNLSSNGKIIFIDRDLSLLEISENRPLSSSKKDLKKLYEERYELYKASADVIIKNNSSIEEVIEKIIEVIE